MSILNKVIIGKQRKPLKMVVFGTDGVGKSTFASMAPSPIFIQTEDGAHNIDIPKFPMATKYSEVLDAIGALYTEEHDFKTIVLDSVDFAEALIRRAVLEEQNIPSIESCGYGRGWVYVREKFDEMLIGLDALWMKGYNIILIAHSDKVATDDPTVAERYDRFTLKLDKKNEPKLREWSDIVGFCNFDTIVRESKDGLATVKRAVSYGKRLLHLERSAAFDAKNRFGLPAKMPLDFNAFYAAYLDAIA
jgi:hypothetical protein